METRAELLTPMLTLEPRLHPAIGGRGTVTAWHVKPVPAHAPELPGVQSVLQVAWAAAPGTLTSASASERAVATFMMKRMVDSVFVLQTGRPSQQGPLVSDGWQRYAFGWGCLTCGLL